MGFDSEDPKALLKSLDGLIGSKSPWRFSALELTALLQLKLKNEKGAKEAISKIMEEKGNKSIPPYLLFRVEALKRSMEQN